MSVTNHDGWHLPCRITHTRVYTSRSHAEYAHLLCLGRVGDGGPAICNTWPPDDDPTWYGTGDQDELDTAKVLPLCPRCHEAVKTPAVT